MKKIEISGVNTQNKGAELMLCAIVQEIERKFGKAIVYLPFGIDLNKISYLHSTLSFRHKPYAAIKKKCYFITRRLRRMGMHMDFLYDYYPIDGLDYFIDASGFAFSDQWNPDKFEVGKWTKILDRYNKKGTKTIFLPQAFGPIEQPQTKILVRKILAYADAVVPRECISFDYLQKIGISKNNVRIYSDFTSLVEGTIPEKYEHLKSSVCIIPNMQMVNKGGLDFQNFIGFIKKIVKVIREKGLNVYLLNHEGKNDEYFALQCKDALCEDIEVVTGLNALEVKGLIGSSYMCITSRFHGLASALNSCVPTLATSWSHKYGELYKDYGLEGMVLDPTNPRSYLDMVNSLLDLDTNNKIRQHLMKVHPLLVSKTKEMWNWIWKI